MIDLHTHTTASDGQLSPTELVRRASAAGITTLSITDHDTTAGLAEAASAAQACGLTLVPGIEITAVHEGRDVHVLGYFLEARDPSLEQFLIAQRADRVSRARAIVANLASLGVAIDGEAIVARALDRSGRSVGRPQIAMALVAAGHVETANDAFEKWLGAGRPAFEPRRGASPAVVVRVIGAAGGVSSLAHPGLTRCDALIPALVVAGLDALEAYHGDHPPEVRDRYAEHARSLGLGVSGGSDFHGEATHRVSPLGAVTLPIDAFEDLHARAQRRRRAWTSAPPP